MRDDLGRPDLSGEFRLRVPLPLVVPLVAMLLIAALTFGFSRVLLTISQEAATMVALMMSANILIAAAFVALRPRIHRVGVLEVALIALYPVVIAVVIASTGLGSEAAEGEAAPQQQEQPAAASGGSDADATLVAQNVQFDTDSIALPAQAEAVVFLDNQDGVEHNFSLYPDEQAADAQGDAIFQGDVVGGGDGTEYAFESPPRGEYVFQCDIHPSMRGTATVE
ncbi:MAG: plastocyanin/azurin family copper-binding protein [Actinomycetota bacterium]